MRNKLISKTSLQGYASSLSSGLVAAVAGAGMFGMGMWEPLERFVYTGFFLTRDRLTPQTWDDRIVVIAVDEASLDAYGSYPWPRDRYAALLDKLLAVQPAAIGFDILMSEPTPEDPVLADSILFSGNVVLAVGGDAQGQAIQVTSTLTEPTQGFLRVGHVKHLPDSDGISRQAFLYERHQDAIAPSFAIALLETYQQSLDNLITNATIEAPATNPKFQTQPEKYDQTQPLWINWLGLTRPESAEARQSPQNLTTLSYAEVMADDAPDHILAALQNKIVLVGYTAVGIVGNTEDPLRTPFEKRIPTSGVYLHAAILDNLLQDRFLQRMSWQWTLVAIVMSGIGSSLLLKPLKLRSRILLALGALLMGWVIAFTCFLAGVWIPIVAPIGTGILSVIAFQLVEERERQTLKELFAINLSPQTAEFIWEHQGELLTQGQIRPQELTATVLFADIRGFTAITETLPSEVLLPWLNRYFEVMTDCIMAEGGVVDKYIGDAIMAAFGAPIPRHEPDAIRQDALAAVRASIAMVENLKSLNQEFTSQGLPIVRFGIGIHTGSLVAGTVGSRHRANYSLFGDTVNVAARLQDMTKQLTQDANHPILLSETTYLEVCHQFPGFEKEQIQLKGRTAKISAYTLDV
ncbi:MAG: adenylate/guanylate cyclase domain-containing protein [Cyanobacteria bacterium J06638_28]